MRELRGPLHAYAHSATRMTAHGDTERPFRIELSRTQAAQRRRVYPFGIRPSSAMKQLSENALEIVDNLPLAERGAHPSILVIATFERTGDLRSRIWVAK